MVRLGNRTYRLENRTNPVNLVLVPNQRQMRVWHSSGLKSMSHSQKTPKLTLMVRLGNRTYQVCSHISFGYILLTGVTKCAQKSKTK